MIFFILFVVIILMLVYFVAKYIHRSFAKDDMETALKTNNKLNIENALIINRKHLDKQIIRDVEHKLALMED